MFISSNTLELTDVQQLLKKKKKELEKVLFLFLFYALQVRFSIFIAIVAGQVFSLAYYFPKSNKLVLDVAKVLRRQG